MGLIELSLSLLITSDYSVSSRHQDSISVSQSPAQSRPTDHSSGPLIITVPIIILPWPRFLLNIINTIIQGHGVSSHRPLRPV